MNKYFIFKSCVLKLDFFQYKVHGFSFNINVYFISDKFKNIRNPYNNLTNYYTKKNYGHYFFHIIFNTREFFCSHPIEIKMFFWETLALSFHYKNRFGFPKYIEWISSTTCTTTTYLVLGCKSIR